MVKATVHVALDVLTATKVTLLALVASSLVVLGDNLCDECRGDDQVCCNGDCFYGSSCLGLSCSSDLNCSRGESCCSNSCVNGSNCLGQNCSSDSDCSSSESCCDKKCKSGDGWVRPRPCSSNRDCGDGKYCWEVGCLSSFLCSVVTMMICLSPSAGLFIVICVSLKCYIDYLPHCRKIPEMIARVSNSTERIDPCSPPASNEQMPPIEPTQPPPSPPGGSAQTETTAQSTYPQNPPPYDDNFPNFPPPSYDQISHISHIELSEPPPSYSEVQEGRSRGVSARSASLNTHRFHEWV